MPGPNHRQRGEHLKTETALKKYNEQLVIEANHSNLAQINDLSEKN